MSRGNSNKISKLRLFVFIVFVLGFWLALEVNLFRLQVLMHDQFNILASRQNERRIELKAERGTIFDRNGNKFATNTIQYDIAVDPQMLHNKSEVAGLCSKILKGSKNYYLKLFKKKSNHVYLARGVSGDHLNPLIQLDNPGIIVNKLFRRTYPYAEYGAQLIGFTDTDDRGVSGIEVQLENNLAGQDGSAVLFVDAPQNAGYSSDHPIQRAVPGDDVYLTIDKNIQTVVDKELENGVKKSRAKAGMAIVMDPNNGAILGMANYPRFDPNRQSKYGVQTKRNRCITDNFEPGSTLKLMTAAALLQEGLQKKEDIVFCENGRYKVYDRTFTDTKKYGWLTFQKSFEKSSNIGMIKLSDKLHSNTLFRYLKNFGFGSETGIGLIGAATGMLDSPVKWSGVSLSSISIGYEISVTTVQLTAAYAAVINGGILYRPYVINRVVKPDGSEEILYEPEPVRRVISEQVSNLLKSFMRGVVVRGTGKKAQVEKISVGGKTGTARKYNQKAKKYYTDRYTASFVGFANYENPKYVCAVIIDEPKSAYYGGDVAAPVFKDIIRQIYTVGENEVHSPQLPIEQNERYEQMIVDIPPLDGFHAESAIALLEEKGLSYEVVGKGEVVRDSDIDDETVVLSTSENVIAAKRVPNLVGLTLREALASVNLENFKISLGGQKQGIVRRQSLSPGTEVKNRVELVLTCN